MIFVLGFIFMIMFKYGELQESTDTKIKDTRPKSLLQRVEALEHLVSRLDTENQLFQPASGRTFKVHKTSFDSSFPRNQKLQRHKRSTSNDTEPVTGHVAFLALLTHTLTSVSVKQAVVFDRVVTNIGECYSIYTGVFTCCKTGVYMLTWNIRVTTGYSLQTALMVNDTVVVRNQAADKTYYSTGTASAVLKLELGHEVWIRVHSRSNTNSHVYGDTFTTFSGFLIN